MGCCGDKRAQLSRERVTPETMAEPNPSSESIVDERQGRIFEYVGQGRATLRGAVSGRTYQFSHPGDRVEVVYDDTFGMMAEREVKPSRP